MFVDELKKAFDQRLRQEEHNIRALERKTQVNYSTLNRLNSKKADFSNIPALTIQRLFPEMRVYFFRSDWPAGVTVTGTNSGAIASGNHAKATVRTGSDLVADDSTRMLLAYWRDLPQSKRFEFLMKLAEMKEDAEKG